MIVILSKRKFIKKRVLVFLSVCALMVYMLIKVLSKTSDQQILFELDSNKLNAENVCMILEQAPENARGLYWPGMMDRILATANVEILNCYFQADIVARHNVKKTVNKFIANVFHSEQLSDIELLLKVGIDPNYELRSEKSQITAAYTQKLVEKQIKHIQEGRYYNNYGSYSQPVLVKKTVLEPEYKYLKYPAFLIEGSYIHEYLKNQGIENHISYKIDSFVTYTKLLQYAIEKHNLDYIKLLIKYGADIRPLYPLNDNLKKFKQYSSDLKSLLVTLDDRFSPTQKMLISDDLVAFKSSNFNNQTMGSQQMATLLEQLIEHDSSNILQYLLVSKRWQPKESDWFYLLQAFEEKSPATFKLLLESDIDENMIIRREELDTKYQLKDTLFSSILMLKSGSKMRVEDHNNAPYTVINFIEDIALKEGYLLFAQMIDSHRYQWADIHQAAAIGDLTQLKKSIQQHPEQLNLPDNVGHTPLMLAMKFQQQEITNWLLKQNAEMNVEDMKGKTALHYAIDSKFLSGGQQLIEQGAAITTKENPDCASIADYAISRYTPYEPAMRITKNYDKEAARKVYFANRLLRILARQLVMLSVDNGLSQCYKKGTKN